jgi:peptidyl-prolyl cis-trans isomerase C
MGGADESPRRPAAWWVRLRREPLVAFLLAGGLLFAVHAAIEARRSEPVRLTAATRAALATDFEALAGRPPGPGEIARLEREYVVDELLLREAIARGLHLRSSAVRGRLVEEMRLEIAGPLPDPGDEELVDFYAEHLDLYQAEPSLSFEHLFLRERPADGDGLRARLLSGERLSGDPFPRGLAFTRYGRSILRGMFGTSFVDALWAAPTGRWSGPLESMHGWHYVRPTERVDATLLPFDAVRDQVEGDFLADAIERAVERHVAAIERSRAPRIER